LTTVYTPSHGIISKLQVRNRREAVRVGRELKLVD
jgi:ATP/maltotriose-dependent transcriptional regulator MalT